jgi:hypothetical protein
MTKLIFTLTCLLVPFLATSQDFSGLKNYKLEAAGDYKPAEKQLLECCDFLLNNPVKQNELDRNYAIQFIMRWMEGTPDYTFNIDKEVMDLTGGESELLSLYFAALSKAVVNEPVLAESQEQLTSKATDILLDYCANPDNQVKNSKKIKKLLKTRQS